MLSNEQEPQDRGDVINPLGLADKTVYLVYRSIRPPSSLIISSTSCQARYVQDWEEDGTILQA
jgi:hypothetical protein